MLRHDGSVVELVLDTVELGTYHLGRGRYILGNVDSLTHWEDVSLNYLVLECSLASMVHFLGHFGEGLGHSGLVFASWVHSRPGSERRKDRSALDFILLSSISQVVMRELPGLPAAKVRLGGRISGVGRLNRAGPLAGLGRHDHLLRLWLQHR